MDFGHLQKEVDNIVQVVQGIGGLRPLLPVGGHPLHHPPVPRSLKPREDDSEGSDTFVDWMGMALVHLLPLLLQRLRFESAGRKYLDGNTYISLIESKVVCIWQ